jgi:metal-sulfur cluster biosynthetic enzyme
MSDKETRQKMIWTGESTHPELIEPLKQALQEIKDPELGLNIIELGLVRDVVIKDDQALLMMILTTPFCPYGASLLDMAKQKAEKALGRPTRIELGMEMWDFSMMEEGAGADWGLF